jgi:hypothetical protein
VSCQSLHFEVALSTYITALTGLLQVTTPDKVLFGSDFPYARLTHSLSQTRGLDGLLRRGEFKALQHRVDRQNAEGLLAGVGGVAGFLRVWAWGTRASSRTSWATRDKVGVVASKSVVVE